MHFELMKEMGWSHKQLMETSPYVVAYCWALLNARRQAEHDANERARSEARRGR